MISIAILLTCYNRKFKTLQCLENLYEQEGHEKTFKFEVFLVDDSSTDGTGEAVKNSFPDVNVIQGDGTLFWNRGMHLAWKEAEKGKYDYYLWLNDDTDIRPDGILEMLSCIKTINKPAIVCGAICSAITHEFTYGGSTLSGKKVIPNGTVQECEVINGNCVLIDEKVHELIGNLDARFPHAIGDHDYGLRLIKAGGAVVTTTKYVGYCEKNDRLPKWCYSETPLSERLSVLYSPIGNSHPKYFFIYEARHFGLVTAIKHYFSIHLRVFFPSLWS